MFFTSILEVNAFINQTRKLLSIERVGFKINWMIENDMQIDPLFFRTVDNVPAEIDFFFRLTSVLHLPSVVHPSTWNY